jgi:uncharacterized membrane protein (DUF106 family)
MAFLNAVLRPLFDALLYPFRGYSPWLGLSLVSLVVAVLMLVVFKATSDQKALGAVKNQIHACLFEIRLYNDDLRAIMRAQGEILRHNATYLRLSLAPMVWMIVPLVLVIAQLEFHYAYGGLEPGQAALVKVELKQDVATDTRPEASLEAPEGLAVETPAVWIPSLRELDWRVRAKARGDYAVKVRIGDDTETKSVRVSPLVVRRSPLRVAPGFLDQLIYPAEPPLPAASPIRSIAVTYPGRDLDLLGWGLNWMVVFFVLSIVFAFALRNRFGVTI